MYVWMCACMARRRGCVQQLRPPPIEGPSAPPFHSQRTRYVPAAAPAMSAATRISDWEHRRVSVAPSPRAAEVPGIDGPRLSLSAAAAAAATAVTGAGAALPAGGSSVARATSEAAAFLVGGGSRWCCADASAVACPAARGPAREGFSACVCASVLALFRSIALSSATPLSRGGAPAGALSRVLVRPLPVCALAVRVASPALAPSPSFASSVPAVPVAPAPRALRRDNSRACARARGGVRSGGGSSSGVAFASLALRFALLAALSFSVSCSFSSSAYCESPKFVTAVAPLRRTHVLS
mmetsp:Transcript_11286/g.47116  ORF Transcript_11286/g.47116 Transcript_11286/m.47116 type:complete len:297 (-) Transcript_11286:1965-2855(-)